MIASEGGVDASAITAARSGPRSFALPFSLALVAVTLTYWTVDIVSPALPELKKDLALSAATAGLVYSLLFLGRLVGNVPAVWLMTRFGSAVTASAGGLVLILGSALAAAAPGAGLLFPARVLQGIGIACLVNAGLRAFLGARPGRGAAMTYFSFAATVGGVLGLQSGGFLTDRIGWRSVFVLGAIIGGVIVAITLGAWARARRTDGALDVMPAAHAIAGEKAGSMRLPVLINFIVFFNYSLFVALPLYAERRFDASPEETARLLMVITVVHLVGAFPVGRAIQRWGAHRCLALGLVVSMVGTFLIAPMPSALTIAAPLVLYGIGQVAASSAGGDIVLHLGGQSARSVSLVRFSSDLGLVVGPYLTGALADAFGYRAPFVALPMLLLIAAVIAFQQAGRRGDAG